MAVVRIVGKVRKPVVAAMTVLFWTSRACNWLANKIGRWAVKPIVMPVEL